MKQWKPRTLAKPGLSIVDANQGRLVSYTEDVLDIKREIENQWAGLLSVFFDTENEEWVIVEHCKDGTDRVCFTTQFLSQQTIDKIRRIDQSLTGFVDPNKIFESEDRQCERELDYRLSQVVGEATEKFVHAMKKDGMICRPSVFFPNKVT